MATPPRKSRSSKKTASSVPAVAGEAAGPDRLTAFLLPLALAVAAWGVFDPDWYVAAHGLADALAGAAAAEVVAHYIGPGQALGLSPGMLFDEGWYRAGHPDAAAAIADGRVRSGFEHYCLEGHADRSPHWLFDHAFYCDANPDLTDGVLRDGGHFNLYDHMLRTGSAQGRAPHRLFDPVAHAAAFAGDAELERLGPFRHWLTLVAAGGRRQAASRGPRCCSMADGIAASMTTRTPRSAPARAAPRCSTT